MRISTSIEGLQPPSGGSVVSLGVFDGVHLGHAAILRENVELARRLAAAPTVVTFRHHPKLVLLGRAPRTLTTLEHRLELFARAGIGHTLVLEFDEQLRSYDADTFARRIAVEALGVRRFVLGFDSKFGKDREGTPERLRELGFEVDVVEKVLVGGRAVSSTAIREAVELGDLRGAAAMLGRAVSVFGTVVRGDRLGRTIGFPTANLDLHHELHPPPGVYACRVNALAPPAGPWNAMANIGFRPTVAGEPAREGRPRIEVHLFDFEGDLYGRGLEVEFVGRLRDEQRFDGLEALKEQLGRDLLAARSLLSEAPSSRPAPLG